MPILMDSCPGLFIWYACSQGSVAGDRSTDGFNGRFACQMKKVLKTPREMQWIDVVRAVTRSMEDETIREKKTAQRPQYTETLYRRLYLHAPREDNLGQIQ